MTENINKWESQNIKSLLYNFFIRIFNKYLKNRWLFFYIAIFIVVFSFLLSFLSLGIEGVFAFIFLTFWVIKQIILYLYAIIPISFNFNIWLNSHNLILYNIFIVLEIIIKIFFVVLIVLFAKNYLNKKIIKGNWPDSNNTNKVDNTNWQSLKNILLDFFKWNSNHLKVLNISIEIWLKYYIPIIWTLLGFLSLFFLLVKHNVNAVYHQNKDNVITTNKTQKITKNYKISADNNIEIINKISSSVILPIKNNNLKKLESQWTNRTKLENILLYYSTKDKKYIEQYKNDKNYKNIENINSYPLIVDEVFAKLKNDLEKNNYSAIYTPFILTKIMIISAYFDWKTLNNGFYNYTKTALYLSILLILIISLWLDINLITMLKYLANKK